MSNLAIATLLFFLYTKDRTFNFKHMPKVKKRFHFLTIYRKVAIVFAALTIVLIGAIVFFSLIRAEVEIQPKKVLQSVEFLVGVGQGSQGEIINGAIEEQIIEAEEQVEATETKTISEKAAGFLTIINTSDHGQTLVATTRFLTPEGILFRLKKQTAVPAGGKVEAEVAADQPGEKGNLTSGRFSIPGLKEETQKLIWAESQKPMTGGARVIRTVSTEDIAKAKDLILKKIEDGVIKGFREGAGKDNFSAVVSKMLSSEIVYSAKPGEEKQNFSVRGKAKFALAGFDRASLENLTKTRLLLSLAPDKEIISFSADKMIIKLENYNLQEQRATLRVYADGETILKKTSPILNPEKLAGMGLEDAKKYLESFEAIESVVIDVFPGWLKTIPALKDHIKIVIQK